VATKKIISFGKKATALMTLLVFTGCAPTMYNLPPGGSQQQFMADQAFCNAQAQTATGNTGGWAGVSIFKQNKEMCMQGKGYTIADDAPKARPTRCNPLDLPPLGTCDPKSYSQ